MKKFIIVSLKHSTPEELAFWMPNDCGYTTLLPLAGIYTEDQIQRYPDYYNDGYGSIAVELNYHAFKDAGLLNAPSEKKLKAYYKLNRPLPVRS